VPFRATVIRFHDQVDTARGTNWVGTLPGGTACDET
jgi:hypothetical protein